ncbi:hypothetical protein RN001_002835 [Aquatica leii]|uniref:Uncharacterized protein n=1 Tax=Aquatica leii TaxID=1421715 RepID=A0AAN7Q5Q1_9COLE|nr:hypothetical protein RN001_002835 [Aquatica leii]
MEEEEAAIDSRFEFELTNNINTISNKEAGTSILDFSSNSNDIDAELWVLQADETQELYGIEDARMHMTAVRHHSKVLKTALSAIFLSRPDKVCLMKHFEARRWKRSERFADYYCDKIMLGNRAAVCEQDLRSILIRATRSSASQRCATQQTVASSRIL